MQNNRLLSADNISFSELRYRRLFEAARDGILIVDPETRRIVDVNPFLVKFLGYTHAEFVGKELFEIGLLRDEAASQAAFRELQETGYIRYDDLPLETKDGRQVAVEFVSNLYQEGDQQIIQCNIRDISFRKRADFALRHSEERFKLVARAVSDVVWDWNIATNNLWWSDEFKTTFGYAANEIEAGIESWIGRIHPDESNRIIKEVRHAIDTGKDSWSSEYRFRCKNGSFADVQDNGYILRDHLGTGIRMVGGMRDLTEKKKIEAQHLRAQRMESIGTLAGGIAHDLNNVLAPIMMSIELLKIEATEPSDRNTMLDTIQRSCIRGSDLVRQVLSFARGLNGERVVIRMRHLVDDLKWIVGETFPKNINVVSHVPGDLWPITGDPTQLHQILLNLAVNARDAMPDGGTLTLTVANTAVDAEFIGTSHEHAAGRYLLLQVNDTGIGIPPEIRELIFEPFFTTKEIGKGTGFGLATVFAIVKGHGGYMRMDSEVGRGTSFKIYLPADPALQPNNTPPPFQGGIPRGRDELILVVDDEFAIRNITQRTLEAFGYRVITAKDGAEAVAIYAKQTGQIALVLTDMMMPVMDGAEAIRAIRNINSAARIIVVSGLEVGDRLSHIPNYDYLSKPFTAQTLLKLVRNSIDQPSLVAV